MATSKAAATKIAQIGKQVYESTKTRATLLVASITAFPKMVTSKIVGAASSTVDSLAIKAQPYVHRIVKVVAPRAESVAKNQRLQSMYHHRFVQGGIEKATPYVSKAAKQPRILQIVDLFKSVSTWALPPM